MSATEQIGNRYKVTTNILCVSNSHHERKCDQLVKHPNTCPLSKHREIPFLQFVLKFFLGQRLTR